MQIKHDDRVAENKVMEGGRCAWRLRGWTGHCNVVLPSNDRGLELVAHGPVSVNDHDARQEASNEEKTKIVSSMAERIRQLEEENAVLKRQVEMFAELVEE
ncbi:uncharacterized protein DS421_16g535710 [Arachis hypogaea]|nr:uncharacterized protein DS421_16g535710 [Arachis hypogaea]